MRTFRTAAAVVALFLGVGSTGRAMAPHTAFMHVTGGLVRCTAEIAPDDADRLIIIWLRDPQGQLIDSSAMGMTNPARRLLVDAAGSPTGSGTYTCHVPCQRGLHLRSRWVQVAREGMVHAQYDDARVG